MPNAHWNKIVALRTDPAHLLERAAHVLTHAVSYNGTGRVLVVADASKAALADMYVRAAGSLGGQADLVILDPTDESGESFRAAAGRATDAHVVFINLMRGHVPDAIRQARKTLVMAQLRIAQANGGRILTAPGYTERMLVNQPDIPAILPVAEHMQARLAEGSAIRVTSPAGTDITIRYGGRPASHEVQVKPGWFGNVPGGEVYFAALETEADGVIVGDAGVDGLGFAPAWVRVVIEKGKMAYIGWDDPEFEDRWGYMSTLKGILATDEDASRIGEFGMGVILGLLSGNLLWDEKIRGTAHIALGNNLAYGNGQNRSKEHTDFVMRDVTVEVFPQVSGAQSFLLMRDGELQWASSASPFRRGWDY